MNYVRESVAAGVPVTEASLVDGTDKAWMDDKYLIPFMENDSLLFELDGALGLDAESGDAEDPPAQSDSESTRVRALEEENEALRRAVQELRESLKVAGTFIDQADAPADRESASRLKNVRIDKNYFDSYAGFGIHREMLSDRPRMVAYRSAIELNASDLARGKDVLDVGCGTGILSMIAARAGARAVCAVDGSPAIAEAARAIVEENSLGSVVQVRGGLIEKEGTIPEGYKCDVIISEWMGYCLLYESMLFSVLHARYKYLRPGGCVMPDVARIHVAGCGEASVGSGFWDDVEGFSMRTVGKKLLERELRSQAHVVDVSGAWVNTSDAVVTEFDLCKVTADEVRSFSSEFELTQATGQGKIHALVVWFDTLFSARHCKTEEVVLTTSPREDKTHWAQTLLVLPEPVSALDREEALLCRMTFQQHSEDYRGLQIVLEYGTSRAKDGTYPHAAQFELV